MKGISIIATLAFAIVVGISAQDSCEERADGVIIRNPDDCSKYLLCKNGRAKKRRCFDDTVIDVETGSCEAPNRVTCENKPTVINDPCPATEGVERIPYPSGNPEKYEFYVLCRDKKYKGYRRNIRVNGVLYPDQRYFKGCPAVGRYRVLYVEHKNLYFLCLDGIHVKTKKITDAIRDTIMKPEELPKPDEVANKKGDAKGDAKGDDAEGNKNKDDDAKGDAKGNDAKGNKNKDDDAKGDKDKDDAKNAKKGGNDD